MCRVGNNFLKGGANVGDYDEEKPLLLLLQTFLKYWNAFEVGLFCSMHGPREYEHVWSWSILYSINKFFCVKNLNV